MKPRLNVPAIGGRHQFAHFLPVAFELQRRGTFEVSVFVPQADEADEIEHLASSLGFPPPRIVSMDLPAPFGWRVPKSMDKITRLLIWANRIRAGDAILCAERTSTLLKRLPGRCPSIIHIPHGAGDRAVGFEKRFRYFDRVLVAGEKDRERLLAEGLVRPDNCDAVGPIKVSASLQMQARRSRLFHDDRPVVLYNPHFNTRLSSAGDFVHRLVEAILRDDRYNLVVAPHVRLAAHWDETRRKHWEALAEPGRVIVDLGSRQSIDMTYTLGADLSLGDVSSQVYEFLVQPRPCLFVNAHDVAWQDSADYAMWQFGEVVAPECDIPGAIARAFRDHARFKAAQMKRAQATLEGLAWDERGRPSLSSVDPIVRAADIIEQSVQSDRAPRAADGAAIQLQNGDLSFR